MVKSLYNVNYQSGSRKGKERLIGEVRSYGKRRICMFGVSFAFLGETYVVSRTSIVSVGKAMMLTGLLLGVPRAGTIYVPIGNNQRSKLLDVGRS